MGPSVWNPRGRTKPAPVGPGAWHPALPRRKALPSQPASPWPGGAASLASSRETGPAAGGWLRPQQPGQRVEGRLLSAGTHTGSWGTAVIRTPLLSAQKERWLRPSSPFLCKWDPHPQGSTLLRPQRAACIQAGSEERSRTSRTRAWVTTLSYACGQCDQHPASPHPRGNTQEGATLSKC